MRLDGGAFDLSHESQGVFDSAQTMAHGERQAIGQTFPSVVVGLIPDKGSQKFDRLVEAMLVQERPPSSSWAKNVLFCSSDATASFSARAWSANWLAT